MDVGHHIPDFFSGQRLMVVDWAGLPTPNTAYTTLSFYDIFSTPIPVHRTPTDNLSITIYKYVYHTKCSSTLWTICFAYIYAGWLALYVAATGLRASTFTLFRFLTNILDLCKVYPYLDINKFLRTLGSTMDLGTIYQRLL